MNEVVSWDMRRADMAMSHEDDEDIMVEGYASLHVDMVAVRSSEIKGTGSCGERRPDYYLL